MELRFAHLCDYAAVDASGKLTVVGAFDIIWDRAKARPVPFPPCYLVASFGGSLAEGTDHAIEVRMVDDDEKVVMAPIKAQATFRPSGPGHPVKANLLLGFGPGVISVPALGDYYVKFLVDGSEVGSIRVSVLDPPQSRDRA